MVVTGDLLTIKEASEWASNHIRRDITPSNISYLIQYGRIKKIGENGSTKISKHDLIDYYKSYGGSRANLVGVLKSDKKGIYSYYFT
jgi:hypothetical protein